MSGVYRYRQPGDVDVLPGYAGQALGAADSFRLTLGAIEQAREAAVALDAVLNGDLWEGTAFQVFASLVKRKPLVHATDNARAAMESAAACLSAYSDAHSAHQNDLYYLRSRLRDLGAPAGWYSPVPDEMATELQLVNARIDEVYQRHNDSEDTVKITFDLLDDNPVFATPPPSNLDRVKSAAGDVINVGQEFLAGAWEGFTGLADTAVLLINPNSWREAWNHRQEILTVINYAVDNPGEFTSELGRAMIDVDLLMSNPARWLGQRVPDILLAFGTMGTGTALGVGAKFARAGGKVDGVVDGLRLTERVTDRLAGLGKSAPRLARVNGGAGVRLDTISGRVAHRLDRISPKLANARRAAGDGYDVVKGSVQTKLTHAADNYDGPAQSTVRRLLTSKTLASKLTDAIPGAHQAKRLDALLTGAPAVADKVDNFARAINGLDRLDTVGERLGHADSAHQISTPERPSHATG